MDSLRHPDQWERAFERRSVGRIRTAIGALLFFSAQSGAHSCTIRDFTNVGAGIRVQDLPILPLNFALSFDAFRTMLGCRLIWRQGEFIGLAFEN